MLLNFFRSEKNKFWKEIYPILENCIETTSIEFHKKIDEHENVKAKIINFVNPAMVVYYADKYKPKNILGYFQDAKWYILE